MNVVFTGDALVTHDGMTGHTGPALVCRAFTHNSEAARASLSQLAGVRAALVLPGHGTPFTGTPAAAVAQALHAGIR